jgi:hypothetical protein
VYESKNYIYSISLFNASRLISANLSKLAEEGDRIDEYTRVMNQFSASATSKFVEAPGEQPLCSPFYLLEQLNAKHQYRHISWKSGARS